MADSQKTQARLVRLPSGDWVQPDQITSIRTFPRDDRAGMKIPPHVSVVIEGVGHIMVKVNTDEGVQPMADRIAAIANTLPEAPDDSGADRSGKEAEGRAA